MSSPNPPGIHSSEAFRQRILFHGMQWGTIRPTDGDLEFEKWDKLFVFAEIKSDGNELDYAQRTIIERKCRAISNIPNEKRLLTPSYNPLAKPKYAWGIFATHNVPRNEDVLAVNCAVKELYDPHKDQWRPPKQTLTLGVLCDLLMSKYFGV